MLQEFWGYFPVSYALLRYITLFFRYITLFFRCITLYYAITLIFDSMIKQEGRPRGAGDPETARGGNPLLFYLSLVLLAFLLALPELPAAPSRDPK